LAWARQIQAGYLAGAALVLTGAAVAAHRQRPGPFLWAAIAAAALAVVTGLDAGRRFRAIEHEWSQLAQERETELARQLERRMASGMERARTAVELAGASAARATRG